MNFRNISACLLAVCVLFGCAVKTDDKTAVSVEKNAVLSLADEDGDETYNEADAVKIKLTGNTAKASGKGVTANGSSVVIGESGTYVLSGSLTDGSVAVNTEGKVHLVLNGASIANTEGPALFVESAEKLILTAANGTKNELSGDGENASGKKGGIYSKDDLVINGSGELSVTSGSGDGIHGNDHVKLVNAILAVNCESDGIDANETITVSESILSITAGKDGMKAGSRDDETEEVQNASDVIVSGGVINITSEDDGISSTKDVVVNGTSLSIVAGGGFENGTPHTDSREGGFFGFGKGRREEMKGEDPGMEAREDWSTEDFIRAFEEDGSYSEYEEMFKELLEENEDLFGDYDLFEYYGITEDDLTKEPEEESAAKAIKAEGNIRLSGTIQLNAADDALNSSGSLVIDEGTYEIMSGDDALHADDSLTVNGGTIAVRKSYEGIEAATIVINGGQLDVTADDDGINSSDRLSGNTYGMDRDDGSSITINGGEITLTSGGDGIDSNGFVVMNGGQLIIYGPENAGNGAIDYAGSFTVNKGTLIAGGAAGMAMAPSKGEAGILRIGIREAQGPVEIKDAEGKTILRYESSRKYSDLVIASDQLEKGKTYTVFQNNQELGSAEISDSVSLINTAGSGTSPRSGSETAPYPGSRRRRAREGSIMPGESAPAGNDDAPAEKTGGDL